MKYLAHELATIAANAIEDAGLPKPVITFEKYALIEGYPRPSKDGVLALIARLPLPPNERFNERRVRVVAEVALVYEADVDPDAVVAFVDGLVEMAKRVYDDASE